MENEICRCVYLSVPRCFLGTLKPFDMPSQDEKSRRKQILDELTKKQREKFEQSLPLSRNEFKQLFDFLDNELDDCDDTLRLTKEYLLNLDISNSDEVISWLEDHGGYCDCEVLANVEEQFN